MKHSYIGRCGTGNTTGSNDLCRQHHVTAHGASLCDQTGSCTAVDSQSPGRRICTSSPPTRTADTGGGPVEDSRDHPQSACTYSIKLMIRLRCIYSTAQCTLSSGEWTPYTTTEHICAIQYMCDILIGEDFMYTATG